MNTFTLPADRLPSKAFSLSFKEPTFRDRREVSAAYPTKETRPGYSLDELLFATSITAVNGIELTQSAPRDPIELLKEMPQADEQYALMVFLSMFTLDEELEKSSRQLGTAFKTLLDVQHTIKKDQMPRQKFSVTFRKLVSGQRMALERHYPGLDSNCGYSFDEMLLAASITHVDGHPVEPVSNARDIIGRLDGWSHLDAQFASNVFLNAVTIDKQEAQDAKDLGKLLLQGTQEELIAVGAQTSGKRGKASSQESVTAT